MSNVPTGPFETEDDARTDRAVRAVYDSGDWQAANYAMLDAACASTGVRTGDYDRRILYWLAGYEPQMCAVIAGIIRRAAQPPDGTITEWGVRQDFPSGDVRTYAYGSHERAARADAEGSTGCTAMSRQVGPWTEVPETEQDGDHGDQ